MIVCFLDVLQTLFGMHSHSVQVMQVIMQSSRGFWGLRAFISEATVLTALAMMLTHFELGDEAGLLNHLGDSGVSTIRKAER